MLKANIDEMYTLKAENTRLKDLVDGKAFEQRYCSELQQPSVDSTSRTNQMHGQSFGMSENPRTCNRCVELKQANEACEL